VLCAHTGRRSQYGLFCVAQAYSTVYAYILDSAIYPKTPKPN